MSIEKNNIAIVLLAYADFESLEIALANYSKSLNENMHLFILQNGRGSYDCERTYKVAKRYERLFPNIVKVVDWIAPQKPYTAIKELLKSTVMKQYDYICKVDDDVFPLKSDWLDKLISCYKDSEKKYGSELGYVTGLVNNNPWGFNETLNIFGLKDEYFNNIGRAHEVGGGFEPTKIVSKNDIYTGCCGTVWGNPYISRWLHINTSFKPEIFIEKTKNLGFKEVSNKKRYSINVMLFKKDYWNDINNGSCDDEHMSALYCKDNDKKIIADLSNPFVHICFFTQRDENKDLLPEFRKIYGDWLNLPYPISLCPSKEYENENRLRFLEMKSIVRESEQPKNHLKNIIQGIFSVKNENEKHKIVQILWIKFKFKRKISTKNNW